MPTAPLIDPIQLSLTPLGTTWLQQYDSKDREAARTILSELTLVSHNEFERSLTKLIVREAKPFSGMVALFATREWDDRTQPYFKKYARLINAVAKGNDLGSEARVALLIRNLCRAEPTKFLNHPTISKMRKARCRALFVIDDFIGSGERTSDFISGIWQSPTIRSWHSFHLISIRAITYSATAIGARRVEQAKAKPQVCLFRDCPTFYDMPWTRSFRQKILAVIDKYGARTSFPMVPRGYDMTATALVFEHGCPDNCPAILWAPPTLAAPWTPLFPQRSVLPTEASAFPPEITRRSAGLILIKGGQKRLALSKRVENKSPIGPAIILVLAFSSQRRSNSCGAQPCDRFTGGGQRQAP